MEEQTRSDNGEPRPSSMDSLSASIADDVERDFWKRFGQQLDTQQVAQLAKFVRDKVAAATRVNLQDNKRRVESGTARVRSAMTRTTAQAQKRMRKIVTGDVNRSVREHVRQRLKNPPVVRLIDRISFTMGITNMMFTQAVLLLRPGAFWAWYLLWIVPLFAVRIVMYHRLKFQYFLLDFCYFANVMCVLNILLFPDSEMLFQTTFVVCNGPLVWAILAWRNSLVFHSLDKITSLLIHIFPALLTLAIRWCPSPTATLLDGGVQHTRAFGGTPSSDQPPDSLSLWQWLGLPMLTYFAWQLLYVAKIDVLDAEKLQRDRTLWTSVRWMTRYPGSLYFVALKGARALGVMRRDEKFDGETWKTKVVFMGVQALYTFLTILPSVLLYRSFALHLAFLSFMVLASAWNGASYYIEVFSRVYAKAWLQEKAEVEQTDDAASATSSANGDESMAGRSDSDAHLSPGLDSMSFTSLDAPSEAGSEAPLMEDVGEHEGESALRTGLRERAGNVTGDESVY